MAWKSIVIQREVPIEMRDGTTLRCDIYGDPAASAVPVLLIRTPYGKHESFRLMDFLNPLEAVDRGFRLVVQDIRGRFASEGHYLLGDAFTASEWDREGDDGFDTVEWIAQQPWCNGRVGMAGVSYMGLLAWMAAAKHPPHLRAISPWLISAGQPLPDETRASKVVRLHLWAWWTAMMGVEAAARRERSGIDSSAMRRDVARVLANPMVVCSLSNPAEAPEFDHPDVRDLWRSLLEVEPVASPPYTAMSVPCLQIGGWYDLYPTSTCENFRALRTLGSTELARRGQHLLLGPWVHDVALPAVVGGVHFGLAASGAGARVSSQVLDFFEVYVSGATRKLPPVRYFVMGENAWKEAVNWPPTSQSVELYLGSAGDARSRRGDGVLELAAASLLRSDTHLYSLSDPVPTLGGRGAQRADPPMGPVDQALNNARMDVLCYLSPALQAPVEVAGAPSVTLYICDDAPAADLVVRLVDVSPDGHEYNISDGISRFRPAPGGEPCRLLVPLSDVAHMFASGHRIRLDVAPSNFPLYDRAGSRNVTDLQATRQRHVFHGGSCQSVLKLPSDSTVAFFTGAAATLSRCSQDAVR